MLSWAVKGHAEVIQEANPTPKGALLPIAVKGDDRRPLDLDFLEFDPKDYGPIFHGMSFSCVIRHASLALEGGLHFFGNLVREDAFGGTGVDETPQVELPGMAGRPAHEDFQLGLEDQA